jgi:RNA polymerase primary sigma factor
MSEAEFIEEEEEAKEQTTHSLPTSYPCLPRLLTAQEEIDLCGRAQAGDERAREAMMEGNIRLVMSTAKRYHARSMTYEDIVQEGIIGLLEAIKKFDVTRGHRFSTYATYWIRQSIVRAIEKTDRMIRLPTHGWGSERKVRESEQQLTIDLGRCPTPDEICAATGVSKAIVLCLLQFGLEPLSLDAMIGDEQDIAFIEAIQDDEAVDPAAAILRQAGVATLAELLDVLKPKERAVMECRFGLRDGRAWTLKECGDVFGFSREGIRHIQIRCLRKIKDTLRRRMETNPDLGYAIDSRLL